MIENIFSDDVFLSSHMVADQNYNRWSVLEGSRVEFFCSFRYLNQGHAVPPEEFVWLHYRSTGRHFRPTAIIGNGKETIIASDRSADENGFYNSTLTFASATELEAGRPKLNRL